MRDLSIDSALDFCIESILIFLILFSPFIAGSITILPLTIVELLSFLLLAVFIIKLCLQVKLTFIKSHITWLILFLGLVIFTLIPIPEGLLRFLSPNTLALYKEFRITPSNIYTLSIYPEATFTMLLQLLSFFMVFFVAVNYLDNPRKFRRIIFTILIAGTIYTLYGIIQRLYTPQGVFSTFTNRNHFAAYIEMIVPLTVGYALTERNPIIKYLLIFLAAVMGLAIFLSQSRAGAVCFSLSILVFLILLKIKGPSKKGLATLITLVAILGLFVGAIGVGEVTKRLQTLQDPLKAMTGRIEVLKDAPRLINDFPLFGTGLGTFIDIFKKYRTFPGESIYRFSHNEPTQLLAESGFIGFALILLFLIFFFKDAFGTWFKRHDPFPIYIGLGCFIAVLSISLHSFFEFMFHVPASTLLFFVVLAIGIRVVYFKEKQDEFPLARIELSIHESTKAVIVSIICLILTFSCGLLYRRYKAESIFQHVKQIKIPETGLEALLEYRKLIRELDRAIALNPSNSAYPAQKANFLVEVITKPGTKDFTFSMEEFQNPDAVLERAGMLYREAIQINPLNAGYYFYLQVIYSKLGNEELKQEAYSRSLILYPQQYH